MSKHFIIYFSYTGNTKKVAQKIQEITGGDCIEIEMVHPYSDDYNAVVAQGQEEVNRGYLPSIQTRIENIGEYDTIWLGFPIWWYTMAPPVASFLASHDLADKTIAPFITNGGWGVGHSMEDIQKACPKANITNYLEVRFNGNQEVSGFNRVASWVEAVQQERGG